MSWSWTKDVWPFYSQRIQATKQQDDQVWAKGQQCVKIYP